MKIQSNNFGCTAGYHRTETVKALAKTLEIAAINFGVMEDEDCCGAPLYDLGFREEASLPTGRNAKVINKSGCRLFLCFCPHCYNLFTRKYPEWGIRLNSDIRVLHVSEYVNQLVKEGRFCFTTKVNQAATFHDPCNLGRKLGIYDAPREVLLSIPGIKFREIKWKREKAYCCGSGGGLSYTYPQLSEGIARGRVKEAIEIGADILVTACPSCEFVLDKASQGTNLKVRSLVELILETL